MGYVPYPVRPGEIVPTYDGLMDIIYHAENMGENPVKWIIGIRSKYGLRKIRDAEGFYLYQVGNTCRGELDSLLSIPVELVDGDGIELVTQDFSTYQPFSNREPLPNEE